MDDKDKVTGKITRRHFIKGSALAIVSIAAGGLLAGCSSGGKKGSGGQKTAVVSQGREEIDRIDLNAEGEAREIQLPGVNVTLQAEKGRIRFLKSDCPDQICVKTGWLTEGGHMAACLPNRSVVVIEDKA